MSKGETYEQFVDKFKTVYTTDDCYTPPEVYETVRQYFCEKYNIEPEKVLRPFFKDLPEYREQDYAGRVVIDNPPFSIFGEIVDYYNSNGVPFILFYDARFAGRYLTKCKVHATSIGIRYDTAPGHTATVSTSFVTNMGQVGEIETEPELVEQIEKIQSRQKKAQEFERGGMSFAAFSSGNKKTKIVISPEEYELFRKAKDGRDVFGIGIRFKKGGE